MGRIRTELLARTLILLVALAPAWPAHAQSTLAEVKAGFRRPVTPAPTTAEAAVIEVGRLLFFDNGLSATGDLSCGTCHKADLAWKDGRALPLDNRGLPMRRRAPTLLNLRDVPALTWDGRMGMLRQQASDPITSPRMGDLAPATILVRVATRLDRDPAFADAFGRAFSDSDVTLDRVSQAIAAFEASLQSPVAPFDRWIEGDADALSPAARHGFDLFVGRGNCIACHGGWRLTDDGFHDIGLPDADLGRGARFPEEPTLQHAFKTPTLRGVGITGPFMHDGSLATLEAVVDHYNGGVVARPSLDPDIRAPALSTAERADLVAFLRSLDPSPIRSTP